MLHLSVSGSACGVDLWLGDRRRCGALDPVGGISAAGKLQRDVGQRLIEPYGRGVRLTPAGVLLARRTQFCPRSRARRASSTGNAIASSVILQIAGFATAARAILPQTVARLRKEHEQLRLRVSERQPDEAIRLVVAGHLDIALVNDWMNAPLVLPDGVERLLIMNDAVDLAVPADHPLAQRTRRAHRAVCRAVDHLAARGHLPRMADPDAAAARAAPEVTHTAEEHQTQLAMVAAGLGIAVMPRLGRGSIDGVSIISLKPAFSRQIYAIWRTLASERPAIAVTVSAIRDVAKDLSSR